MEDDSASSSAADPFGLDDPPPPVQYFKKMFSKNLKNINFCENQQKSPVATSPLMSPFPIDDQNGHQPKIEKSQNSPAKRSSPTGRGTSPIPARNNKLQALASLGAWGYDSKQVRPGIGPYAVGVTPSFQHFSNYFHKLF